MPATPQRRISGALAANPGSAWRATTDSTSRNPVIVLTYAHAGSEFLQRELSRCSALACTSGTGLLPLFEQAAATWRGIDGRGGPLSSLAASSLRAMADTMITSILVRTRGTRWCEFAQAPAGYAGTFLELYGTAKFVCLHRNCPDVIRAGVRANPWGLADSPFGPFAAAYPGSSVAAIAAYWAAFTESLLEFEAAQPRACHRVRYEDLVDGPDDVTDRIFAFLGLGPDDAPAPGHLNDDAAPAGARDLAPDAGSRVPASQLPPPLGARVNELLARLGYPRMA
jgi:hypothetical protein